ncbi:MAG: peptidyl-prolyl cis-trans isomerase [Candidatus Omnitrophica bacterium]|nr:peptidyl-prolyl cis-trans isomerase [Candidatus Omnitrophota bacterium]
MKNSFFFFLILLAFSLTGCEKLKIGATALTPSVKPEGTIIAQVGNMYITLEQLDQEIAEMNARFNKDAEPKKLTPEEKTAYLKEVLVPRYLFYIEAKANGIDKEPKIREQLLNVEVSLVAGEFLSKETIDSNPPAKEIEAFYAQYKDQFRPAEERRIREIMVPTEAEAKEVLIELLKGTDFASLAQERSKAESASKGGDLGFIAKGQRGADFKKFDEIAFSPSLENGQISSVFKDKRGYYIIRLDASRGGQVPSLNDVWDEVKSTYVSIKQRQKMQELNGKLAKKTSVTYYQEKVK